MPKTDQHDRDYLNRVATDIRNKFPAVSVFGGKLKLKGNPKPESTDTEGWRVTLGGIQGQATKLDVWLDKFSGHAERKLWVGAYTEDEKEAGAIAKGWALETGEQAEVITTQPVKKLKKSEFNRPWVEIYKKEGTNFFGYYEWEKPTFDSPVYGQVIEHAYQFLIALLVQLDVFPIMDSETDFAAVENRKVVVSHLRRERNGLLALKAKERDGFVCQICAFDFQSVYGYRYAEAHHKVPLAKLEAKVTTQVGDLLTVCANCHRALHLMTGRPEDIELLKKKSRPRPASSVFRDIPNDMLVFIPTENANWEEIEKFALTFNAFDKIGFDKAAEIASNRKNDTLTDLRTCLWFEQRRYRHYGHPPEGENLVYIRDLVAKIREKIEERAFS